MGERIHDCLKTYIPDGPIALVDFPDIRNVGDSAIWLGEMAYLASRFGKAPAYVSTMHDFSASALEREVPSGPIFIHGGGNFGDIWGAHQTFRERIIDRWPDRRIIQFPQSIHYQSQAKADQTARVIGRHKDFVLLVRDEESRSFAEAKFDCTVMLCPDMAFCIGAVQPTAQIACSVLAMLREDREKVGGYDLPARHGLLVEDWITESRLSIKRAKAAGMASALSTFSWQKMTAAKLNAAAQARFARGVRQLSRGRAIVTDRLHVHIVSLLLGKPHAVLDNNYGKIRRFMATFSGDNDLSYQAASLDDAIEWAADVGRTARPSSV